MLLINEKKEELDKVNFYKKINIIKFIIGRCQYTSQVQNKKGEGLNVILL